MERPKPELAAYVKRTVNGEIMYLNDMRQYGRTPGTYASLTDAEKVTYEARAAAMRERGTRPDVMDAYDKCDPELSPVEASCKALIDELAKCNDNSSRLTCVDIHVDATPEEALGQLQKLRAGTLLAAADQQLAQPHSEYYGEGDVRKQDSELTDVRITSWKWSAPGVVRDPYKQTNKNGQTALLYYPSSEPHEWGEIDIVFDYEHPTEGVWIEKISLYQGIGGELSLQSSIWAQRYAEMGYEGHGGESMPYDERAIVEFADLIAKLVGDEPMSEEKFRARELESYIGMVRLPQSTKYLREWLDLSWSSQVFYELHEHEVGPLSLYNALKDEHYAQQAHATLVDIVTDLKNRDNRPYYVEGEDIGIWGE